jgi:outer membrane lipase/esterase
MRGCLLRTPRICLAASLGLLAIHGCGLLPVDSVDLALLRTAVPSLVIFGDSLSDSGNFSRVNPGAWSLAFEGYDAGRFTSGPASIPPSAQYRQGVWHEVLMGSDLGIPSLEASTNCAFGGATTRSGTHLYVAGERPTNALIRDLGDQVDRFLEANDGLAVPDNVYVVWAGGNDLIDAVVAAEQKHIPAAAMNASREALHNAAATVRRLARAGATRIVWGNLPPLYGSPWAARLGDCPGCMLGIFNAVVAFNRGLEEAAASLEAEFQGLRVYVLDAEGLFNDVVMDAFVNQGRTYGITNFWDIAANLDPDSDAVDSYLFWDGVHPTSRAHAIIAEAVHDLLVP